MHITTHGLVLREVAYKEADKILTLLTREGGKCTVTARGCRRKNSPAAASSQLLVWSELVLYSHQERYQLKEGEALEQFWGVRTQVEKLALASYFAQLTEVVADEGRPDDALLSHILNALYALDKLAKPLWLVKAAFELRLMAIVGYEPLLEGCAHCGVVHPARPLFHPAEGVLSCADCHSGGGIPLGEDTLAAMRHVVYGDPKRLYSFVLGGGGAETLKRVCQTYLLTQLERDFSTLDFYESLMRHMPEEGL